MKKMVFVLVALLTAYPTMAAVTLSTAVDNVNKKITVSYNDTGVAGTNKARAFALKIIANNGAKITSLTSASANDNGAGYGIYPGTIAISEAGVSTYNIPVEPDNVKGVGGQSLLGTNQVIVAMGSLYKNGVDPAPAASGALFSFTVDKACTVTIAPETAVRGGVTGEDANALIVAPITATVPVEVLECLKNTDPGYAYWAANGKPDCWCWKRQCKGDANNYMAGNFWVYIGDLNYLKLAYGINKMDSTKICSDFNHTAQGNFRVYTQDLAILKANYGVTEASLPVCDPANYNFYTGF